MFYFCHALTFRNHSVSLRHAQLSLTSVSNADDIGASCKNMGEIGVSHIELFKSMLTCFVAILVVLTLTLVTVHTHICVQIVHMNISCPDAMSMV